MRLLTEPYAEQQRHWPADGRHILAQYDESTIVVYQAYRPEIGEWAARHGHLGGPAFSLGRMSWVKPNFLWLMFRSGWGTKEGQEVTLAIRIRRAAFDAILAEAVHSSSVDEVYGDKESWKAAVARSTVRLQWDPDHDPAGAPLERRAIQLGLRGDVLRSFAREWIVELEDISSFVAEQRGRRGDLVTPRERVYPVVDPAIAARLGVHGQRA
ncbi:MAG: DUF4291 domain-containing protein [Deltaproteobacteria bacterium]|nr:DUF4291 domain-containing protein [Deltaproteobacteria bacterium]